MSDPILIARHGDIACSILPGLANRHGLITGATGTGKTVTLQKLAESFSQIGVPVFLSDVKGDLTGIVRARRLGKATMANIRQNIVIALVTVGLLLAGVLMGGVTMAAGMLFHEGSVLIVIANAMRLLRRKTPARANLPGPLRQEIRR